MQLADRIRADIAALGVSPEARLGIAVSGGADSLALLLLAHEAGLTIEAATVDHGLRAGSTGEARFVASLCEERGIAHTVLTLDAHRSGNVSDWARRERYAALDRWADARRLAHILTAHHADDQLETVIMRLNRASGVGGLAGIRPVNGQLVRPLLGWRKHELEAVVEDRGLIPVDDPSNRDHRFDRARLRDALAEADWLDPLAVARSAALLAEAEAALEWCADIASLPAKDGAAMIVPANVPDELLRRRTRRALAQIDGGRQPAPAQVDRAMAALRAGEQVNIGNVLCAVEDGRWRFSIAPPRRPTRHSRATSRDEPAAN